MGSSRAAHHDSAGYPADTCSLSDAHGDLSSGERTVADCASVRADELLVSAIELTSKLMTAVLLGSSHNTSWKAYNSPCRRHGGKQQSH